MKPAHLSYTIRGGGQQDVTPPTNLVVNNANKTLDWTNSVGHNTSQHEYSLNYSTGRVWQPVTSKPIQVGNVTIAPGDIAVRVKAAGSNPASTPAIATTGFTYMMEVGPGPDYFELTETEELAAYVYYALNAKNANGTAAQDSQSVNEIPAIKGDIPLTYDGISSPTLTKKPPVYSSYGLGSIWFDNEPLTKFRALIDRINTPVEVSLTMVRQPGTGHEAWYNYGGIYAGDTGSGVRLAHADKPVEGSQAPPFFHISNLHVKFTASRADLWVDGEFQGFVTYEERNEPTKLDSVEVGVHTNNSQWEFIAYHLFPRTLTEQERNNFFTEAAAKFHWGQEKQLPYAKDVFVSRSGDTLTANYTFTNPLGFPEDTSKTIYRWVGLGEGWLSNQIVRDGLGKTCTMANWPTHTVQVKVEVQVFDTQGNTWKRLAGGGWLLGIEGTEGIHVPDSEPEIGVERRITYGEDDIYGTTLTTVFDSGQKYIHQRSLKNLADQSYIADVDNAPVGLPSGNLPKMKQHNYGIYSSSWYNSDSFDFTIDLKGVYDITKIFYNLNSHTTTPFTIWGSRDGYTKEFLLYQTDRIEVATSSWYNVPIDVAQGIDIPYLIFGLFYAEIELNGVAVYGKLKQPRGIQGFKNQRSVPSRTFTDTLGTNAFLEEENFDMIANTSTVIRYYNDNGWFVSSWAGVTLLPEQIKLFPKTSHMWDFDQKLQEAKANGHKTLFCHKKTPDHLGYQGPDRGGNEVTPTDPGLNGRDISVTTDPMSYTHMARIAFLLAARYGKNTNIDPVYDSQYSDENPPYGLDLFEYFEVGNEPDGFWKGEDQVSTPLELAALYSAVYDGHKGAMGPGFGLKAADPNMKFANGGFAGIRTPWFKQMMQWWDENRGVGDYPIDVLNIHHYNAWERDFNTPMWSDVPAYGVPPEKGLYLPEIKELFHFRDRMMPNAEIWNTETGYDEHYGGMFSPHDRDQLPRSRHKAAWILRTFLAINRYTDVITQYWYGDDWNRLRDFDPDIVQRETFMTCGYVEGITTHNDRNRQPMMTYWYIASLKADMEGYIFSHPVIENGIELTTEPTGITLHPELWVYAFKKDNGDSCLVAWIGCDDWKTHSAQIPVTETQVEVIDYVEHETRQSLTGNMALISSSLNGATRYINQTITEYPLIIKTAMIGVAKLEAAINLRVVAGKLIWDDLNTESVTTEIYSSDTVSGQYELETSSMFVAPEYTLTSIPKAYYKIKLVSGDRFSDFSSIINI